MKLSEIVKNAIIEKNIKSRAAAAKFIGLSPELLRLILEKDHIPKDKTLSIIASKLGVDGAALILTAHSQQLSSSQREFLLTPKNVPFRRKKRVFPLSQEQCDYLEKIMNSREIQIVRQYRQVTSEGQAQIKGYIDFMFYIHRQKAQ